MPKQVQIRDTLKNKVLVRNAIDACELMGVEPNRFVPVREVAGLRPIKHVPRAEDLEDGEPDFVEADVAISPAASAPVAKPKRDNSAALAKARAKAAANRAARKAQSADQPSAE